MSYGRDRNDVKVTEGGFNLDKRRDVSQEQLELSTEAVKAFRTKVPGLTSLVRGLTGSPKARVLLTSDVPCTDGVNIWLRPPLALGKVAKRTHVRSLCNKRDPETKKQMCEACAIWDDIVALTSHEVAHMVAGSFEKPDEDGMKTVLLKALDERAIRHDSKMAQQAKARIEALDPQHYLAAAGMISPYLPTLYNMIEDSRVNLSVAEASPGLTTMFEVMTREIMEQGLENFDTGEVQMYYDANVEAQVFALLYMKTSGYNNMEVFFSDEALGYIEDSRIQELIARFKNVKTTKQCFVVSLQFLEALRELGLCQQRFETPEELDDVQPEDQDEDQPSDSAPEEKTEQDDTPDGEAQDGEPDEGSGVGEQDEVPDSGQDDSPGEGAGAPDQDDQGESDPSDGDVSDDDEADGTDGQPSDQEAADGDQGAQDDDGEPDTTDKGGEAIGGSESAASKDEQSGEATPEGYDGDDEVGQEDGQASEGGLGADEDDSEREGSSPEQVQEVLDRLSGHNKLDENPDDNRLTIQPGSGDGDAPVDKDADIWVPEEEDEDDDDDELTEEERDALDIAIAQQDAFEGPSMNVLNMEEFEWGVPFARRSSYFRTGWDQNFTPGTMPRTPEIIMAPALRFMRKVFDVNRQKKQMPNLKSGKVNARVLARRVPTGDARLFSKTKIPGKRDYFVVLGIDISESTTQGLSSDYSVQRLDLIKRAALAQAELLHRLGVKFTVIAHSGNWSNESSTWITMQVYHVKKPGESWTDETRTRLASLKAAGANLDGHTFEYYRRLCDKETATDKVVLYYTDGHMPQFNFEEEIVILQDEIKNAPKRNLTFVGVGIETDSPKQHGLDTVQLDALEDLPKVIHKLEEYLK